jgi:hypothetical protein
MQEVKVTTIFGETANKIRQVLDSEGILIYRERNVEGRNVLDVFTEVKTKDKDWYIDHCLFCGEYLPYGVTTCPECQRLQIE